MYGLFCRQFYLVGYKAKYGWTVAVRITLLYGICWVFYFCVNQLVVGFLVDRAQSGQIDGDIRGKLFGMMIISFLLWLCTPLIAVPLLRRVCGVDLLERDE